MSNEPAAKGEAPAAPSPDKTDPALKFLRAMYILAIVIFSVAGMASYFLLAGNMVVALLLICLNIALALAMAGLVLVLLARRIVEWRLFSRLPEPSGRRSSEKRP